MLPCAQSASLVDEPNCIFLLLLLVNLRRLLLVLVRHTALRVQALRVHLSGIHLTTASVLLCAADLLGLVLHQRVSGRPVAD